MISRVLVMTSVVSVASVSAAYNMDQYKSQLNDLGKNGSSLLINNKWAMGSTFASKHVQGDLKKAGVETIGYMFDQGERSSKTFVEPSDLLMHFGVNYSIRKGCQQLEKMGFTVDAAAKKCDVLPEGIKEFVNPAVRTVAETVTEPELLTLLALNYVLPTVIAMASGSNNSSN
jgi:hypothetical protein